MVVEFGAGAILACLTTLGGIGICSLCLPAEWKRINNLPLLIGVFYLFETFLFAGLSFTYTLYPSIILSLTFAKACVGVFMLTKHRVRKNILKGGPITTLWFLFLLINSLVPTSNFDCFSAHFPIPNLFLEHRGYPLRPDFQYLDALPLSAHLWLIPSFALGLEGYANMVFPIFSVLFLWTIGIKLPKNLRDLGQIIALSIPEFIRVSMDPMVDTATFFFVLVSFIYLFKEKRFAWPCVALLSLSFSIKPTLLPMAPLAFLFLCMNFKEKENLHRTIQWSLIALVIASIWPVKNWVLHGSPWYPYLGSLSGPDIPPNIVIPDQWWPEKVLNYLLVIFADHRYFLSLGWVPLFFIPFFALKTSRRSRLLQSVLVAGFILTLALTPFKNRYFLPYLLPVIPYVALFFHRHLMLRRLLYLSIAINAFCFLPYLLQPLHAVIKNQDVHAFYSQKYESYPGYHKANQLPPGKILLIGQASHWIKRPHEIAIPSETFLDFSRIKKLRDFEDHLISRNIKHVVVHMKDLKGLANHTDPWYARKAHLAQTTFSWIEKLKNESEIIISIEEHKGVELIQLNSLLPSET